MLDGETLSTGKQGIFFQIGACEFFPAEGRIGATFNRYIDLRSSLAAGRTLDPDTLMYWLDDSNKGGPAARQRMVAGLRNAPSLVSVLHDLADFCQVSNGRQGMGQKREDAAGVWSHGAAFDCAMLEDTYESLGLEKPFKYNRIRDTRTLFAIAGFEYGNWCDAHLASQWPETAPPFVQHDGESDAIAQALGVIEALRRLDA